MKGVAELSLDDLARPVGPAEGPFAEHPYAELVLHINREVIHHGAEILLLRDLYRARPLSGARDSTVRGILRREARRRDRWRHRHGPCARHPARHRGVLGRHVRLNPDTMAETVKLAEEAAPAGTKVTAHVCNVADAAEVARFRDEVVEQHATDHVNLVFNNAGIGGGGSFLTGPQEEWERTFGVCWGGVYNCSRAFVPLLVASDDGYLVNTSSVNGFWAAILKGTPHTAYSSAKFAVKGFSEALLEDFRVNAPHVKVAVVMPGHIGTDIVHQHPPGPRRVGARGHVGRGDRAGQGRDRGPRVPDRARSATSR